MTEATEFHKKILAWLKSISGLTALVGSGSSARIYQGWPQVSPELPMVTFVTARTPDGEFPGHAWQVDVTVELHAASGDTLDTMDDVLTEWIADNANNVDSTLSTAAKTSVGGFTLAGTLGDDRVFSPEDASYLATTRRLTYHCALTGLSEG